NWLHNTLSPDHADAELQAMRDTRVRGRFSYGWGQGLSARQTMDLEDLDRVRREHFSSTGLLSLGAAIRTPIPNPRGAVPIEVIQQECAAIRKLGLPMTMHAPPGIVSVLAAHGLLGKDLQLVHPQGVSAHECGLLAEHGTSMSCSPVIEMHYAQAT